METTLAAPSGIAATRAIVPQITPEELAKALAASKGNSETGANPTVTDIGAIYAAILRNRTGRAIDQAASKASTAFDDAVLHGDAAAQAFGHAGEAVRQATIDAAQGTGSMLKGAAESTAGGIVYGASAPVDVVTHAVFWPVGQGLRGLGWLLQTAGEGLVDTTDAGAAMRVTANELFEMSNADFEQAWGYYRQSYIHAKAAGEHVGDGMVETGRMVGALGKAGYHIGEMGLLGPVYTAATAAQLSIELADLGLGASASVLALATATFAKAAGEVGEAAAAISGDGKSADVTIVAPQPTKWIIDLVADLKSKHPSDANAIDAIVERRWPALFSPQTGAQ